MLAATVRVTADLDLAEECVQSAFAKALDSWGRERRAEPTGCMADHRRAGTSPSTSGGGTPRSARRLPLLVEDEPAPPFVWGTAPEIEDDRLRLIFTCCHPALHPKPRSPSRFGSCAG